MTDEPQDPTSGPHTPENPTNEAPVTAQTDAFGQPVQPQFDGESQGTTTTTKPRSARVGLIAALAVGALVGGVAGAGVATWAVSANQDNQVSASTTTPQNIVVNDTESVNVVTAVAAKAAASVVTISVTSNSEAGTGSGVILSKDGYVLTNTHVVTLDGEIANPTVQVTTSDGHLYEASIVGTDPIADLAVIKLKNASGLQPAEFANSSKLNVGETAVAIGAPLGLSNTVTDGIVSALNRSISIASSAAPDSSSGDSSTPNGNGQNGPFDFWQFDNGQGDSQQSQTSAATISLPVIQTDAAINPGNSGGALLNSDAQVIGINVAIASAGDTSSTSQSGSIGVGFAIPANLAQRVANEIIKNGKATHGLLGASVADVTSTSDSSTVGALIKDVTGGGAAASAGLKAGDVVTNFDGVAITSSTDLTAQVRFLPAGAKTDLTYVRDGKSTTVSVTLGELK
ncbi:MAG TPA: trypsin-like peptidase domain-containing protein [Lacisediminihabitans sp.]|uniref:S1C family serine protease n=1 Tax=Lacisediminihabitans sp. TaxID=2787631 RepID=UPI002ED96161